MYMEKHHKYINLEKDSKMSGTVATVAPQSMSHHGGQPWPTLRNRPKLDHSCTHPDKRDSVEGDA